MGRKGRTIIAGTANMCMGLLLTYFSGLYWNDEDAIFQIDVDDALFEELSIINANNTIENGNLLLIIGFILILMCYLNVALCTGRFAFLCVCCCPEKAGGSWWDVKATELPVQPKQSAESPDQQV